VNDPWQYCYDPATMDQKVIRYAVQGQQRFGEAQVISGGRKYWIPDGATWNCETAKRQVVDVRWTQYIDNFPGRDWAYCFNLDQLKGKVLRHSDGGDAHYVDRGGNRHWIPNGSIYNCLKGRGVPVVETRWRQYVTSIRELGWANCEMAGR
jgi:hypothetical protein